MLIPEGYGVTQPGPLPDDRRDALAADCERSSAEHSRAWTHGYPPSRFYRRASNYRRGFLTFASVDESALTDPALATLLAAEPVTSFSFDTDAGDPRSFAAWPLLPRVRDLHVCGGGPITKALLRSPLLRGVRGLSASVALDDGDLGVIATDPRFAGLTRLSTDGCRITDAGVAAVAHSPVLTRLTDFEYGVTFLAARTSLTEAALEAVAASPLAARLTRLDVATTRDARSLLYQAELMAAFPALRELRLKGGRIEDGGAEVLARLPNLAGLRSLGLPDNGIGPRGVLALLSSPHLAGVEELDLSRNSRGNDWLPAVAAAPRRLRTLWASDNGIHQHAAESLAASSRLAGLRWLSLGDNPLYDGGAVAIARSSHLAGLCRLNVTGCRIGDDGALALAGLPRLRDTHALWLADNSYGAETAARLRERLGYDPAHYS